MAEKTEEDEEKILLNNIENNDIDSVRKSLTSIKDIPNCRELFLHKACEVGNKEIVELLLNHKINIDAADIVGDSPLHIASYYGYHEIVELLLQNGAIEFINKQNQYNKRTSLHVSSYNRHKKVVEVLLRYGASLHVVNLYGNTPLDNARWMRYDDVELMINKEEERRLNVGNVGCELLRASRAISGFDTLPPEIQRAALSFFDRDGFLTDLQIRNVIDFGFDCYSLANNIVPCKKQFISQIKLEF